MSEEDFSHNLVWYSGIESMIRLWLNPINLNVKFSYQVGCLELVTPRDWVGGRERQLCSTDLGGIDYIPHDDETKWYRKFTRYVRVWGRW